MSRFKIPEIVLGIGLGTILSLFVLGVGSYQTSYCEQSSQNHSTTPKSNDSTASTPLQQSGGGDHEKAEHPKHPPFFACGANGLLKSAIGFMDSHEGFFVGGFTLSLVIATVLLWRSTEKLWAETKDAGERQTADTRILQRAYISVSPRGVSLFISRDAYSCDVSFDNVGNLPARRVNWFIDRQFSDNRFLNDFPIKETNFEGNIVIAPGTKMKKGGMRIESNALNSSLTREGQKWLYVWGEVRYDDGFGGEMRFTKFCHRYNLFAYFMNTQGTGGIHEEHARYHIYGNDAT